MNSVAISGSVRDNLGTKEARNLRRNGEVPCVVYGGEQPIHFSAPKLAFRDLVYSDVAKSAAIELNGNQVNAVLQDIQFHPVTDEILHIDFIQLVDGKPVALEVPVKLTGNARGVRNGGKLKQVLRTLKIKSTPDSLLGEILVDIAELRIGQSIRVSDVKPEGFEILNAESAVICTIKTARNAVEDEEEEGGEEAEGAEGATEAAAEESAES